MPPFPSLSDRQKWDVIAYVYTLSTSPEIISEGEQLYQQHCADCHGENGQGDGPQASQLSSPPGDLTDQSYMASQSAASLFDSLTMGIEPDMPAYGEQLSETERWALVDYMRSLTYAKSAQVAESPIITPTQATSETVSIEEPYPYPYPEPSAAAAVMPVQEDMGTVHVQVVNGSNGPVPDDLEVTLYAFEDMQMIFTQTINTGSNGQYDFLNISMPAERVFLAGAIYQDTMFGSDIAMPDGMTTTLTIPVTIYDVTTDTSVLKTDRLHILFDFTDPENIQVVELYIISNPTQRTVVAAEDGGPVVRFTLPEGAVDLQFQDGVLGERYVQTEDGFADTVSVRPGTGEYQVVYMYKLPYERKLDLIRRVNLDANAVVVLMPDMGVKVKSDQLVDGGVREVQGTPYRMYSGSGLSAGSQLMLNLSGRPKQSSSPLTLSGSRSNLIIGLGVFGIALIITGLVLYRRSRSAAEMSLPDSGLAEPSEASLPEDGEDPEALMDAIIALDDLYKAGKLPEEAYLKRRAELKEQLNGAMGGLGFDRRS